MSGCTRYPCAIINQVALTWFPVLSVGPRVLPYLPATPPRTGRIRRGHVCSFAVTVHTATRLASEQLAVTRTLRLRGACHRNGTSPVRGCAKCRVIGAQSMSSSRTDCSCLQLGSAAAPRSNENKWTIMRCLGFPMRSFAVMRWTRWCCANPQCPILLSLRHVAALQAPRRFSGTRCPIMVFDKLVARHHLNIAPAERTPR